LSKNSNFLWEMLFFFLNMSAKKREKVQPIGHFWTRTWKILRFSMVRSKNRNKSRLSRNATKLYRHLCKNTYRWCAKFRNIPNKCRFFLFFQLRFCAFRSEKKSRLIRNVTKLFTSSICIFIEVCVKFHRILNKFRFILIFQPKRVKS